MEVLYDTPQELIELGKMIDWSQISEQQLHQFASKLRQLAGQYGIKPRKIQPNMKYREVHIPGCPQKVGNFFSEFDFTNISPIMIKGAFQYIKGILPQMVPCVRNS